MIAGQFGPMIDPARLAQRHTDLEELEVTLKGG